MTSRSSSRILKGWSADTGAEVGALLGASVIGTVGAETGPVPVPASPVPVPVPVAVTGAVSDGSVPLQGYVTTP